MTLPGAMLANRPGNGRTFLDSEGEAPAEFTCAPAHYRFTSSPHVLGLWVRFVSCATGPCHGPLGHVSCSVFPDRRMGQHGFPGILWWTTSMQAHLNVWHLGGAPAAPTPCRCFPVASLGASEMRCQHSTYPSMIEVELSFLLEYAGAWGACFSEPYGTDDGWASCQKRRTHGPVVSR